MALDNSSASFPDVYDWICHLQPTLKVGSTESLELTSVGGRMVSVNACSNGHTTVSLSLWWDSVCLGELGECSGIGNCSEEEMHENLFSLFSKLCIYAFLKVTHKDIVKLELLPLKSCKLLGFGLKKVKQHNLEEEEEDVPFKESEEDPSKNNRKDIVELQRLDIGSATIESPTYKRAFNSLFSAASYSHLVLHAKKDCLISTKLVVHELHKLAAQTAKETLIIIGPTATDRLMKSLAAKFTQIRLRYRAGTLINPFEMSYSSSLARFWTITSYCPRLSMELETEHKKKDANLELALSHQMLYCLLHFRHEVSVETDWIDVEFKIDNLRCQAFKLDSYDDYSIPSEVEKECYFPAKITLTIAPENKSGVHVVSLGASSLNPAVSITKATNSEAGFQAEQTVGSKVESKANVALKVGKTDSYTHMVNNWMFEQSVVENTEGRIEWILCDNSHRLPVFDCIAPQFSVLHGKTWSRGEHYKGFRDFARGETSDKPFTQERGVVFAGDLYGKPITWRFNRDLLGQTLKWIVHGKIWLAYYPNKYANKYHTRRYMEIRYHDFCEQVELSLVKS